MTCGNFRNRLMEGELGRDGHVDSCPACARFFEDHRALRAAEKVVAAEAALDVVPPQLEAVLLAEFARAHRRKRVSAWWWAPAAIAASLALLWLPLPKRVREIPHPPASRATVEAAPKVVGKPVPVRTVRKRHRVKPPVTARKEDQEAPFIQVPYTLPLAPYERAAVIRMEMPVAALIAAGLPFATANTGARAEADVVVGEDGRARAIRVISISAGDSERSIYR